MRRMPWLLLVPLTTISIGVGAAEDSLANLVYFNDRLEVHPRVGVGGRYDSNVEAQTKDPQDELAAIGMLGVATQFAWSEVTSLTADAEARLVVTDRPEDRWRNQGSVNVALKRTTAENAFGARAGYVRSDDPDDQTGERLLVDTWSAGLDGDRTGLIHRVSAGLNFNRSDYIDPSRAFDQDARDANTYSASLGYGLKLDNGDELTVRAVGDRMIYDQNISNQDSTGAHGFLGWSRQISETIGLAIEGGAEYRRYDAGAGKPADDILSPAWLVNGRTVTADESTWSLTLSGGVEDTIDGNPALASRAGLDYSHPFTDVWSVRLGVEGFNLRDLKSTTGQPKNNR
ncbi:MAG TPA: hypothetical protein VHX44_19780 [Planctomycetota bacterium]|nr:hypothetical protein [Planctomycetota bacterium]